MTAIDLIPSEYRAARRRRRRGALIAGIATLIAVGVGTARGALEWAIDREQVRAAHLEQGRERLASAESRLKALDARRALLEERLRALDGVLRGPDLAASFLAIDQALKPEVRFLELSFVRQSEVVAAKPQAAVQGYFMVLPKGEAAGAESGAAWQMEQRLEIRGQASGHGDLTEFLDRLGSEPAMRQVRLLDTGLRNYTDHSVVDFRLAALLADRGKARP